MGGGPGSESSNRSSEDLSLNQPSISEANNSLTRPRNDGIPLTNEGAHVEMAQLLWSKSKVYIHPTAYAKNNVAGWLAISQVSDSADNYLLSWLPEALVEEGEDYENYVFVETAESGTPILISPPETMNSSDNISSLHSSAFSLEISSLYSVIVQPPTLTAWYGYVQIFTADSNLPPLYFHDEESRSTVLERDRRATALGALGPNQTSPQSESTIVHASWGGESLIQQLKLYAHLLRSAIEPNLFLINPSKEDTEVHSTSLFDDDALRAVNPRAGRNSILHQSLSGSSSSAYPDEIGAGVDNLTFSVLSSFSRITRSARTVAQTAAQSVLSHPLAKPILKNIPEPLAQFANVPGELTSANDQSLRKIQETAGVTGFDSARIYLAKWARVVAEEGERARRRERNGQHFDGRGRREEEDTSVGAFEILASTYNISRPRTTRASSSPIVLSEWKSWFDDAGKLLLDETEAKKRIFQRGLSDEARKRVWPFLLQVFPWTSNSQERSYMRVAMKVQYAGLRSRWKDDAAILESERFYEESHRIEIDCLRTDRTHPMFESADLDPSEPGAAHSSSNANIKSMQEILTTWVFGGDAVAPTISSSAPSATSLDDSADSGLNQPSVRAYVQSMSDLLSPIFVATGGDVVESYYCFSTLMERMKGNFMRDQSGIQKQLSQLGGLIRTMDGGIWDHLEKTNSTNLFFAFRWLICGFKRELSFSATMRLWEVLWTDHYTPHFHLFVALAIIEQQRDVLIKWLREFDEILKYINELSNTLDIEHLLSEAEILYLTFKKVVDSADSQKKLAGNTANANGELVAPVGNVDEIEDVARGLLG